MSKKFLGGGGVSSRIIMIRRRFYSENLRSRSGNLDLDSMGVIVCAEIDETRGGIRATICPNEFGSNV